MNEIREKTEAEVSQEQLRHIIENMVLCYEDKIHGRKPYMRDMSIEELLRFMSYAMRFDAMVIEAVADELEERGVGGIKLPDNVSGKLHKKATASPWASFWRKQK